MGVCSGMCQYATAGTPCDCKCGGTLHGIRAGLHAPSTHAGKLHIDLEHAGQMAMIFDDHAEPTAETTCIPAVDSAAEEKPMEEGVGSGTAVGPAEATGTGGAGLATAGPAPEAQEITEAEAPATTVTPEGHATNGGAAAELVAAAAPAENEHGATDLPLPSVRTDNAGPGVDHVGSDIHDALPGLPHGSDDHGDHRRSVLLDGFHIVPVTREWCEGGAWREWCGWRIDGKRGPFYGATPEEAAVAARRGSLRIVRAA